MDPLEKARRKAKRAARRLRRRATRLKRKRAKIIWKVDRKIAAMPPDKNSRLAFLQKLSEVRVKAAKLDTPVVRRAAHNRRRRKSFVTGNCWACSKFSPLVSHHIIQIQNGGCNWHRNLINICRPCHAIIHPWLAENVPEHSVTTETNTTSDQSPVALQS